MSDTIDCPKCDHVMFPCGSHEDEGETECDECGFQFVVQVEYQPVYATVCVEHTYGEFEPRQASTGKLVPCRSCMYCGDLQVGQYPLKESVRECPQ